jgi:hypothetical protein
MQIATRNELIELIKDAVIIDYRIIDVTNSLTVSKAVALNVSPDSFRILATM